MTEQPLVITLSARLYTALLILYPRTYRNEYGAQMVQVFHDVARDSYRRQRVVGIIFWWYLALFDLILTVIEQRRKGKAIMSKPFSTPPMKGTGLGLMCIMGGLIYFAGGLWLSISGVP